MHTDFSIQTVRDHNPDTSHLCEMIALPFLLHQKAMFLVLVLSLVLVLRLSSLLAIDVPSTPSSPSHGNEPLQTQPALSNASSGNDTTQQVKPSDFMPLGPVASTSASKPLSSAMRLAQTIAWAPSQRSLTSAPENALSPPTEIQHAPEPIAESSSWSNPEVDAKALLAFKDGLLSLGGSRIQQWSPQLPLCSWVGVICDDGVSVTALMLESQGLQGGLFNLARTAQELLRKVIGVIHAQSTHQSSSLPQLTPTHVGAVLLA